MTEEDFKNIVIGQTVYMRIIDDRQNVAITKGRLINFEGVDYRDLIASFDIKEFDVKYHFDKVLFDRDIITAKCGCFTFELYFDLFEYVKHAELRILKAQEFNNRVKKFLKEEASILSGI